MASTLVKAGIAGIIILTCIVTAISSQSLIFAEEKKEDEFIMAGGVTVSATFKFRDGTESSNFQVFQQQSGFAYRETPVFKLKKVVSNTPLLYRAADESLKYGARGTNADYPTKLFDVVITLSKNDTVLRTFEYKDCTVTYYKADTSYNTLESWVKPKGFALIDDFTFDCIGYQPVGVTLNRLS